MRERRGGGAKKKRKKILHIYNKIKNSDRFIRYELVICGSIVKKLINTSNKRFNNETVAQRHLPELQIMTANWCLDVMNKIGIKIIPS